MLAIYMSSLQILYQWAYPKGGIFIIATWLLLENPVTLILLQLIDLLQLYN